MTTKAVETCAGCAAVAPEHPMVAVVRDGDHFVNVPVCKACHEDPAHRTSPIKGHFFPRQHRTAATIAAGSGDIQG